jgi:hypothetical protein
MTPTEAGLLTRYIKAACPAQAIDDYTYDAWADVLEREPWLTLNDAKAAVIELKRTRVFIDVSEVITQARETHQARLRALQPDPDGPRLLAEIEAKAARDAEDRDRGYLPDPVQVRDLLDAIRRRRRGPA